MRGSLMRAMKLSFSLFFLLYGMSFSELVFAQTASQVSTLIERHIKAQSEFDQITLRSVTHSNYVEISPKGEIDERARMLEFYAAEKEVPAPEMLIREISTRDFGETKLAIVTLAYQIKMQEQVREVQMRASYFLCKENQELKICSVHYTPIR